MKALIVCLPSLAKQIHFTHFNNFCACQVNFVSPIEYHCMMVYEEISGLIGEPKTNKKDCSLSSTCSFISFRFVQNSSYISCATTFTYHLPTNEMFLRYPLSWNKWLGCSTIVGYPWRMLTSSMLMARQWTSFCWRSVFLKVKLPNTTSLESIQSPEPLFSL